MAINLFDFSQKPTTPMSGGFNSVSGPGSLSTNVNKIPPAPKPVFGSNIQKGRGATNLFSDEQEAFNRMLQDGIDEIKAKEVITQRRQSMLGALNPKESQALQKMMADGLDSKTAVEVVKEQRKYQEEKWAKENPVKNVGRGLFNVPVGAASLVAEQTGNVLDFATGGKKGFGEDVERIKTANQYLEGSVGAKTGRVITGIGETLAVGPTKLAPTIWGRAAQGAAVGGVTGAAMPVLEQGSDATMGDIATGGAIGGAIGAAATPLLEKVAIPAVVGTVSKTLKYGKAGIEGGIKGVGKSIGEDIKSGITEPFKKSTQDKAGSIALGGLINPAKLDAVKKGLMVEEGIATPQDVGKWMLNRVKPGNKQEIADQLIAHSEKSKQAVDEALSKIPDTFENQSAKKALTQILNDLEGRVGFEDDALRIGKLLGKEKYTLTELNAVKREMDNIYNIYKQSGEVSASLNAQGLNKVRQDIRKFIENEAKKYDVDVRMLNNETSVARGLAEGILKKDNADNVREMLSAFAPAGLGSIIGAGQSIAQGNSPWIVLRDALIGGAVAKTLGSTKFRTALANKINSLGAKEMSALEKYISSGGSDKVSQKVAENIIKQAQNNPQKLLPYKSTVRTPIITQQTYDKGIIQESKIPLKNTKYGTNNSNGNNSSVSNNILSKPLIKSPLSERERKLLKPEIKAPVKTQLETTLKGATTSNIDEVTQSVAKTLKTTKTAEIKAIIQRYLKEFGKDFKNKIGEMIEEIAEKIGAKLNLISDKQGIGVEKTALLKGSDDFLLSPEDLSKKFTGRDNLETNLKTLKTISPDGYSLEKVDINKLNHNIRADDFENPKDSLGKIEGIIKEYKKTGKIQPLIIDSKGNVMDGNHRINAYKQLGIKEIPVYFPIMSDIKKIDNLATRLLKEGQTLSDYYKGQNIYEQAQKSKPLKKSN